MRINFQKITAIVTSALLTGMTLGVAAAANYPSPFVVGSTANVAVVYGTNAATSDAVQAGNIQTDLQSRMGTGTGGVTTSCAGGDCYLFEIGSTKLNFGDRLNPTIKTGAIDESELPNTLSDLDYISGDGGTYGYTQEIRMLTGLRFKVFADKDYNDEKPGVGIMIAKNDKVMNYTVSWKKQPESDVDSSGRLEDIENSKITLLGKEYTILTAYNESADSTSKMELMGGAIVSTVNRDETVTHTLEGKTYAIRASYIADTKTTLCVSIDGAAEECKSELNKGETTKLSNGVQLGVRAINYAAKSGTIDSIDFSLGAEKLTIANATTVKVNDDDIDGLVTTITQSTSGSKRKLGNIIFAWTAKDEYFIADTNKVTFPALGGIKLVSNGLYTPAQEEIKVTNSGSKRVELIIPIKDGTATIPLLYGNETAWSHIGQDDTHRLNTGNLSGEHTGEPNVIRFNITAKDDLFVASWNSTTDAESYLLYVTGVTTTSGINYTTIKNKVTAKEVCTVKSGDDCKIGNIVLTTSGADPNDDSVYLTLNAGASFVRVYSKEGMVAYLPFAVNGTTGGIPGKINLSVKGGYETGGGGGTNDTSWILYVRGEDKNDNLGTGQPINITVGWSSNKVRVNQIRANWSSDAVDQNDPDLETEDGSEKYMDYVMSDVTTKITYNQVSGSQYDTDLVYGGSESYGLIYLAGAGADVTASGTGTTSTTTTVAQLGEIVVKDSEVSSMASKNLIVVGGSCINAAAAKALGGAYCGASFTDATGVGSGEFLIQSVADVYATGKVALLVAGYNADDTVNAAKYLTTQAVDTSAGKKYKGTSATSATLVTTA